MWCKPGVGTLSQLGTATKAGGGSEADSEGRGRSKAGKGCEEASLRKGRASPEERPARCVREPLSFDKVCLSFLWLL